MEADSSMYNVYLKIGGGGGLLYQEGRGQLEFVHCRKENQTVVFRGGASSEGERDQFIFMSRLTGFVCLVGGILVG